MTEFNNPYNFVPALPRDSVQGELGDHKPVGHSIYLDNHWSGTIVVKLPTKTPLLIPTALNSDNVDEQGHKTYDLRTLDGLPYLPPTSVKGMLRAAYETVTNSRLSVFVGHNERLAYRNPAGGGSDFYPAVVGKRKDGNKVLRLLEGAGVLGRVGRLPRYRKHPRLDELDGGETSVGLCYEGTEQLPMYRDRVWVRLNPGNRFAADLPPEIRQQLSGKQLLENVVTRIRVREQGSQPPGGGHWRKGWVYITGANINGKVYERVFLEPEDASKVPTIVVNERLERLWTELITNYQQEHEKDIEKRSKQMPSRRAQDYLGKDPGKTAYSRHVYTRKAEQLAAGSLCYVQLKEDCDLRRLSPTDVVALLPVTISRRLYDIAPARLLDESLYPAKSIESLSPADRVFGWVHQASKHEQNSKGVSSSYKGQLRVHSVKCTSSDSIQEFGEDGFPLAILGQPKPQQGKFYAAKDRQGKAFDEGTEKGEAYQNSSQGLRGRKVYPHHKDLPNTHWDNPERDRTQQANNGHFQEYRRSKKDGEEQRDDQNRSIKAWVKPGAVFTFSVDVINLSDVELGALLYLLNLPEDYHHRLGGGKPLGFGSIRLELDESKTDLKRGQDLGHFYSSLTPTQNAEELDWKSTILKFKQAVSQSYPKGKTFEQVPFIAAFEKAAKGYSGPVHYPRLTPEPQPDGESFKWFVENEAQPRGQKLALPDLISNHRLPLDPTNSQKQIPRRR